MTLHTDNPARFWEHVYNAQKETQRKVEVAQKIRTAYHGPYFRTDGASVSENEGEFEDSYNPENSTYEFLKWIVTQLVHSNPRVDLSSRAIGVDRELVEFEHWVNQWILETDLEEGLWMAAHDSFMPFGVMSIERVDHPYLKLKDGGDLEELKREGLDPEAPAKTVRWARISPDRFFRDQVAEHKGVTAFEGHVEATTKEDLRERAKSEEGWNLDAINALVPSTTSDGLATTSVHRRRDQMPDREEVYVYHVWVRDEQAPSDDGEEYGPDDGFHGSLYVMAQQPSDAASEGSTGVYLREQRGFFGPETGPYRTCEYHYVPDEPTGLSPIIATEAQNRDLNRQARALSNSLANYAQVIIVDDTEDGDLAELLKDAPHHMVLAVPGFEKNRVESVEKGGATDTQIKGYSILMARRDRALGMSNIQRGIADSNTTATTSALADQNSDVSVDGYKRRFRRFAKELVSDALFYAHSDPEQRSTLGPGAIEAMREYFSDDEQLALEAGARLVFRGGQSRDVIAFGEMGIDIAPMSMELISMKSKQNDAMVLLNATLQIAQAAVTMPGVVDWSWLLDEIGEAWNRPNFGKRFHPDIAQDLADQVASGKRQLPSAMAGGLGVGKTTQRPTEAGTPVGELLSGFKTPGKSLGVQMGNEQRASA